MHKIGIIANFVFLNICSFLPYLNHIILVNIKMDGSRCKGLFTPRESRSESEKDQRTSKKDQRINTNVKENSRFRIHFRLV